MRCAEKHAQCIFDSILAFIRCQLQNRQIFLLALHRAGGCESVVGDPELAGGKQGIPVDVLIKRARFTDKGIDDVPVIYVAVTATAQTRQLFHHALAQEHVEVVQPDFYLDPFADQAAMDGVYVAYNLNRTPETNAGVDLFRAVVAALRKRLHRGLLLSKPSAAGAMNVRQAYVLT